jgi:hypothetical protein
LNDWVQWLPLAEFAANHHTLETTDCSAFFGNYGFHLQITFGRHPIKDSNNIRKVNTKQMAQCTEQLFSELRVEMKRAQVVHSEQANKSRGVGTPLGIGDKI